MLSARRQPARWASVDPEAAREHAECTRMTAVGRMVGFMTAEATGSSVISKPILLGTDVCAKRLVQAEMRRPSH